MDYRIAGFTEEVDFNTNQAAILDGQESTCYINMTNMTSTGGGSLVGLPDGEYHVMFFTRWPGIKNRKQELRAMSDYNERMLQETLKILQHGSYMVNGKTVHLKLSAEQMEKAQVLLPDQVREISSRINYEKDSISGKYIYHCWMMDSFQAARQMQSEERLDRAVRVLVLNFANPVNPGGGVRHGARAQEEDLCRKSSLLLSLESENAFPYYQYNRGIHTYLGSDALIFSPEVEIIRDERGHLLEETVLVSVLTCAAPMLTIEEDVDEDSYSSLLYNRIMGMLKCSAYFNYRYLVLGAWGCGAFENDAAVVSDMFASVLKELNAEADGEKNLFSRIDFAVLGAGDPLQYNYREFYRNFGDGSFY